MFEEWFKLSLSKHLIFVFHFSPSNSWGAYAYWISAEGYKAIISSLQKDVGSLLWKGKRMRCYQVKPVDKIIPRKVASNFSEGCKHIHVATHPAFFRAPMLTSKLKEKSK